jgi:hypothetical protein
MREMTGVPFRGTHTQNVRAGSARANRVVMITEAVRFSDLPVGIQIER